MIHQSKGIVLRSVKYGETSLVVSMFTELFGIQSYLVNGVRSAKHNRSNYFQPSAILDMQVYHRELKNLQRIKEFQWSYLYNTLLSDVTKNAVALFMIELLHHSLKQPEPNPELFAFAEDAFIQLDKSPPGVAANFPLYFAVHLAQFFGFQFYDQHSESNSILDLQEGRFSPEIPPHKFYLDGQEALVTSELLRTMHPEELAQLKLNKMIRRKLLLAYQSYYAYHIQDFGEMRTLLVLQDILESD